ncbi:hypothetical protein BDK51DRAFT_46686 [Blyttiomyces helicus]|uniref:Uncharacterized protein n=1 Tax=Blyttiomyces helicus TaxID=388810 RepID=A0A4P9W821_9FUNG|nr:hypothetical protein BDK51DRAFT_46686 [Blyttiomyces helicus]|eukprot:RKO87208.1 hypothetical protein BDK51DRAFT_46686 [Blyttiomyces helicus]
MSQDEVNLAIECQDFPSIFRATAARDEPIHAADGDVLAIALDHSAFYVQLPPFYSPHPVWLPHDAVHVDPSDTQLLPAPSTKLQRFRYVFRATAARDVPAHTGDGDLIVREGDPFVVLGIRVDPSAFYIHLPAPPSPHPVWLPYDAVRVRTSAGVQQGEGRYRHEEALATTVRNIAAPLDPPDFLPLDVSFRPLRHPCSQTMPNIQDELASSVLDWFPLSGETSIESSWVSSDYSQVTLPPFLAQDLATEGASS